MQKSQGEEVMSVLKPIQVYDVREAIDLMGTLGISDMPLREIVRKYAELAKLKAKASTKALREAYEEYLEAIRQELPALCR